MIGKRSPSDEQCRADGIPAPHAVPLGVQQKGYTALCRERALGDSLPSAAESERKGDSSLVDRGLQNYHYDY